MPEFFCGVDFGTTNSSVALSNGEDVRVLDLDPMNDTPASLPSLLYMGRDGERVAGREAANMFIERNVDREVVLEQVDLGVQIAGYVDSEGDVHEFGNVQRRDLLELTELARHLTVHIAFDEHVGGLRAAQWMERLMLQCQWLSGRAHAVRWG